jgi:hypothetical protein
MALEGASGRNLSLDCVEKADECLMAAAAAAAHAAPYDIGFDRVEDGGQGVRAGAPVIRGRV